MASWADDEHALERARRLLAERFPGAQIEILECFDIAYSGWECEYQGALISRDGVPEIVIVDRVGGDRRPDIEQVREQLAEYKRLISDTERVLKRYSELAGTADHVDMDGGDRPEVIDLKWELSKAIVYATEAASAWDQPVFLRAIGMHEDWLNTAIEKPASVPLDEFVRVYDAAAKRARWQTLSEIVREVTQRQRFREWP